MGLDRLPLANSGRIVRVFVAGEDFIDGRVQDDPLELVGIKAMGVHSTIATPLRVGDAIRGVLAAASTRDDAFDEADLHFLGSVARWVGLLTHHAALRDQAAIALLEEGRRLAADELVTVLAHDLGNYLTPLRARLEFALRSATRDSRTADQELLSGCIANIDEVTLLATDLLDVTRLDEGMLRLRKERFALRPLVEHAARSFADGNVAITVDIDDEITVRADRLRLGQVLTNLLSNAVKHSPRGGTVTIDAMTDTDVVVRVMDEGPGVPTELIPRVFTRYARGPRSTGLGIGLYLAERIAREHGGSLTIDSTTTGATFVLRLPSGDDDDVIR
jgi:signal transduction histidine kinase